MLYTVMVHPFLEMRKIQNELWLNNFTDTTSNNPVDIDGTAIFFRGFRILQGVLKSLEIIGSMEAEDFILTGCSGQQPSAALNSSIIHVHTAGGISTYIHADYVRTQLSPTTKYAAIADAGYGTIISRLNYIVPHCTGS